MKPHHGQSLVEFAVAVTALAVLPLGMVLIAQVHDLQMRAIQAARHAAFDSTWWRERRSVNDAQELLRERLFADVAWKDPWGEDDLIAASQDVTLHTEVQEPPGRAPAVTRFILRPLVAISGFLGERFDVDQHGFHTSTVAVAIRNQPLLPPPLDALGIQLRERASILGDPWSAAGPAHVVRRVSGLVPTSMGAETRALLDPLTATVALIEPAVRRLCWGRIDPEQVPADRLAPAPATSSTGAGAC